MINTSLSLEEVFEASKIRGLLPVVNNGEHELVLVGIDCNGSRLALCFWSTSNGERMCSYTVKSKSGFLETSADLNKVLDLLVAL